MKNLELRSSLIKSGVLIGLFIFFIYAFAAGDSGGIGGTLGSLISAITFVIGLCLALIVSVVVIFGVYFAILYLYDAEVSKTVFAELQGTLSTVSKQFPCDSDSTCCTSKANEISPVLTADDIQPLQSAQNKLATQLTTTNANVDALQKTINSLNAAINTGKEELLALSEKAIVIQEDLEGKASSDAIAESAKKLATDISSSIKPLGDKIAALEETVADLATANENDDTDDDVQEKIDQAVAAIQKELTALKKSMVSSKPETESVEESRHRILEYFSNKKDENKFVKLVKEKVTKDMTYAQVDEFLVDSLSKEATAILADHPSLTKDYIRTNRQKG